VDEPLYHVLLEGRKVGPYDRRTVVGMRIKKTLTSEHVLITDSGVQLTVADLVRRKPKETPFQPSRSGSYSLVQATYSASLLGVRGEGYQIPRFRGEVEARIQTDVLRLAGRFRKGLGWKDDRVKLPIDQIRFARVRSSVVDLWLAPSGQAATQCLSLELFMPETAGEFVEWLQHAKPWPESGDGIAGAPRPGGRRRWLWMAAAAGGLLGAAGLAGVFLLG